MLMNQELLAKYAYLDELDCRGWAWEILRRRDDYRTDYARLQTLAHPEPFDSEHAALTEKWHVRRLLDPDLREVPEFFYERYQNIPADLMEQSPREWDALGKEMRPPLFTLRTWKHSIICKDLNAQGYSLNEIARGLYPGFEGIPSQQQHEPARDRVNDDLKRLKILQAKYLKIAFSEEYAKEFGGILRFQQYNLS